MSVEVKKKGYTIKEMAELTGLSQDTLRFYEKEGIIFPVKRLTNGHREFQEQDLNWLNFIGCLRSTGMPYSVIQEYKALLEQGDATMGERRQILLDHREKLIAAMEVQRKALEALDWKIEHYYQIEDHL